MNSLYNNVAFISLSEFIFSVRQLKSQVPLGMCYCVDQHQKARDQTVEVLEHYNVVVTQRDIFSRCQVR